MLKRVLCSLAAMAGLLATMLALPASAALSVQLISSTSWGPDSGGFIHIVGEVVNNGDQTANFIEIDGEFLDSGGTLLDTDFTFALVDKLNPGEKSPFDLSFTPPAGYADYRLTVNPDPTSLIANHNFTLNVTNMFVDSIGDRHFVGQATNNNSTVADLVEIVGTFYNPSGVAVATEITFVQTNSTASIEPGQTAPFELILDAQEPAYASYVLVADSESAPSSGPAPTPTPTPSPSATAPAQAPTLVAPTTATAGVLITVGGTAAPGAAVELWGVTAPNGTITRVNTPTATADANGNWTKTIRPLRNVNLQARVGSAVSGTRFIAVKTDVTESVAPLAGCVVQVSGRVFEPKPGRTVFIRAVDSTGRTVSLGTGTVQSDGRFLLRKGYTCGQRLAVYTVIEGDAVNRPGATGTQPVTTRR